MKDKIKSIKENKVLKAVGNILYIILFILVVLMLIVVALQRFSNNDISFGGFRIFNVATGSMIPKYQVGDILIAKEILPEEIKVGDDIVYKGEKGSFQNKVITHQVISIEKTEEKYKIVTKGIANTEEDPEITEKQVYGKIIYKVQSLSYISKLISNIYVFYFIIFLPIAIILYRQIKAFNSKDDGEENEKKQNSEDK